MSEFTGQVQALGRVVIPKAIRETLKIDDGDYVVLTVRKVDSK